MASSKTAHLPARMTRIPPFTLDAPDSTLVPGETIPRRNAKTHKKLVTSPEEGILTIFDIVKRGAEKFGDADALGTRTLVKTHKEVKKVEKIVDGQVQEVDKEWTYFELSGYNHISFKQYETLVLQIGAGLRQLGLVPEDKVHMFASTSANWLSIAHGSMSQSIAIVTAYDTLGEDGLRHSLVSTKAKAIYLEPHLLSIFIKTLGAATSIQYIILNSSKASPPPAKNLEALKSDYPHIKVLSYDELQKLGEESPVEPTPPSPQDLCCIMYTSGSSGTPKGVPIKHKSVVAAVAGATTCVGGSLGPGDRLLAYLPLAHIFEFVFENACLYWGGTMGYGSIRTLSQANCRNCLGDIQEYKPTLMVGIPTVWETVRKGIIANVNKGGLLIRALFWSAIYGKQFLDRNGLPGSWVLDATVLKQVKAATGGRLRFCMNGAAPIAKETQEFISTAISPLINGYGMTETTAMGSLCDPLAWTTSAVGDVPSCIEIKLVDFAEAGYLATNKPNPQGEVWIRGESVMEKYWDDEETTKEAIAEGGWFKTGDIGEWDKNGHLKIIDRKKNLVKTLNGEYLALEKLESVFRSATVVSNICVYASIEETNPVAIIVPAEPALKELAKDIGVDEQRDIGELVNDIKVQQEILKQLQAVGKRAGLASMEIVAGVIVSDEEWTPQNNLITTTNKLNRRAISERYQKDIKHAYEKSRGGKK
ncbi:hypothetical protein B0O99DRAFT_79724 [Bisporella sp. PMI_857]|nr:hypothetical protein B0O99DRAFT_79724 [Bisporella sp. PMI_857]